VQQLQAIFDDCGLIVGRYEAVHGGDINHAYCLYSNGNKYFLKVNDALRYPHMFEREAHGLTALKDNSSFKIPEVIKMGAVLGSQYLLLEWIEKGEPHKTMWYSFGETLAHMHKAKQLRFGWTDDNYIGSLVQLNGQYPNWHTFYTERRIMSLVKKLADTQVFTSTDIQAAEKLCSNFSNLFPEEPPALLHGDLWGGNYLISNGHAVIFDPAVYCGHREMDIGMTALFGGFDRRFYETYEEIYPLAPGWQRRMPLTQLYPLLVHAVLFGGSYVTQVRKIIRSS
jgi:fructosamine-3-kinase